MNTVCPDFDLFRHVLVTGGTGSGKTASVILPLLRRAISSNAASTIQKAALFVVDVKGDITLPLREEAMRCGRADDVIEVALHSNASTNLLQDLGHDPFTGGYLLTCGNSRGSQAYFAHSRD